MPRTRFDKKKHDKLSVLVCGNDYKDGGTLADGADKTGMSRATLCRRLAQPGGFTVDELLKLGRQYHIPIEDIRAAIQY